MSISMRRRLLTDEDPKTLLAISTGVLLLIPLLFQVLFAGGLAGFHISLLTESLIFAIFATAFNLLYGYTGLLSFGHAMFVAAAGYTAAKTFTILGAYLDVLGGLAPLGTWVLAILLGIVVAGIFAVFIGYLAVQLEEIYFALITLSFSMALYAMANQDVPGQIGAILGLGDGNFTNRSDGLTFVPGDISLLGFEFSLVNITNPLAYYFLTVFVFVASIYALWRIVQSPFGMVCKAIRENPQRARAIGVNVTYHQWMTFIISGLFSGLAGAMLVILQGNVNPQDHVYWTASAAPVVMTVIGGPLSFIGPIVGAFSYEYIRWGISQFPLLEEYWEFSFGVLLLVVVLFFENGVAGGINRVRDQLLEGEDRTRVVEEADEETS